MALFSSEPAGMPPSEFILRPLPSYLKQAGTSYNTHGKAWPKVKSEISDYFASISVLAETDEHHPAFLNCTGLKTKCMIKFQVGIYADPSPEAPDCLLVEIRRLSGSRDEFAILAQSLADAFGVTFQGGKVGPLKSLPAPKCDEELTEKEAAQLTERENRTTTRLLEMLCAEYPELILNGLKGISGSIESIKSIFEISGIAREIPSVVADLAAKGSSEYEDEFYPELDAVVLATLTELLIALPRFDLKVLETAASAAVLGINGKYHSRREALRCIVALAERPEPEALKAVRDASAKYPFEDWVAAAENCLDDAGCVFLAKRVREMV